MKRNKKEIEAIIDQTADAVRHEQPDARAVDVAARGVRADVVGSTHAALEAAGALRRVSVS